MCWVFAVQVPSSISLLLMEKLFFRRWMEARACMHALAAFADGNVLTCCKGTACPSSMTHTLFFLGVAVETRVWRICGSCLFRCLYNNHICSWATKHNSKIWHSRYPNAEGHSPYLIFLVVVRGLARSCPVVDKNYGARVHHRVSRV